MVGWPAWWHWDLEFTPHLERRTEDRGFSDLDLRRMLECARDFRADAVVGRWVIGTRHRGRPWEVMVEPDAIEVSLVVVTAYPVDAER